MKYATQHFAWSELTLGRCDPFDPKSVHEQTVCYNLLAVALQILQPLREALGPIAVTSGYRTPIANERAGGSNTSQHVVGEAVDFRLSDGDNMDAVRFLVSTGVPFDQLILEHWSHGVPRILHASHKRAESNRREIRVQSSSGAYQLVSRGVSRAWPVDIDALRAFV